MAHYNNLPVYRSSYNLLLDIYNLTKNFSREYKYTLGQELKQAGFDLIRFIYQANQAKEKAKALESAREILEIIKLQFRLLKDLRQINLEKFVNLSQALEDISRQLAGWHKKYILVTGPEFLSATATKSESFPVQ